MREQLNELLRLRYQLNTMNERILELKARSMSPKNQVISDMPRGGNRSNAIEEYVIKSKILTDTRDFYSKMLNDKWNEIYQSCVEYEVSEEVISMLKLRFYFAHSWKTVSNKIGWNSNKCFRVYRLLLDKFNK